jgi:putative membrane protein insertion efficiency factor
VRRLRRAWWVAGTPVRAALIGCIRLYRATLSGWLGGQCRFYPSCSHYAEDAIRVHGAIRGGVFATWRLLRCNPFGQGGIDPVPPPRYSAYDAVLRSGEPVPPGGAAA